MHRIDKFLARLDAGQREKVLAMVERIERGALAGLDLRKLAGTSDTYRARVGKVRIKFTSDDSGARILSISFRNEHTYRDV